MAFIFKTPVSVILYNHLPFFNFNGLLKGLTIVNIVIYELLAFVILAAAFMAILSAILSVTSIIDKLVKLTAVFEIPLKVLGILVGFVEGIVICFVVLFVGIQFDITRKPIMKNEYAVKILESTPVLSDQSKPIYDSLNEIYYVAKNYKKSDDKDKANLKCLDILLKYKVLDPEVANNLIVHGKINIEGASDVVKKYEKK